MRRFSNIICALAVLFAAGACAEKGNGGTSGDGSGKDASEEGVFASFTIDEVASAASLLESSWKDGISLPENLKVGGKTLTLPQYQYAFCKAVVAIADGGKSKVGVKDIEAVEMEQREGYDRETMPLTGGPMAGSSSEDLLNVAGRMLSQMDRTGSVPEFLLFYRDDDILHFGSYRATVGFVRALAAYADAHALPSQVSVRLGKEFTPVTIKAFAQEFVKLLQVWENNRGTIYADSKHSGSKAFTNVRFIPTPSSYAESDNSKLPETMVAVGSNSYTVYQAWELALRGIVDLITVEGSKVLQSDVDTPVHTPGDGVGMDSMLPAPHDWNVWTYPWYEADETLNLSTANPVTIPLLERLLPWWYVRAIYYGQVNNLQYLETFKVGSFTGMICSMRCLLIMARFYKQVLDAGVETNVYTFMKDKTIDPTLY